MTDLLGLLNTLQAAVAAAGNVRIAQTAIEGMAGAVDHHTSTIHIDPNLTPDEWFAVLSDGLEVIARRGDPFGMELFGPVTADGAGVVPVWPRLRLVADQGNP